MMALAYLCIYLYHAYAELWPLIQGQTDVTQAAHIAAIAIATLFALVIVIGIASVRPARTPMKVIRRKYQRAWDRIKTSEGRRRIELEVRGAWKPVVTSEVVEIDGHEVTRIRVGCDG